MWFAIAYYHIARDIAVCFWQETNQEIIILLTIRRVRKQHYRTYTFIAKSELGTVSHDVLLKECKHSFSNRNYRVLFCDLYSVLCSMHYLNIFFCCNFPLCMIKLRHIKVNCDSAGGLTYSSPSDPVAGAACTDQATHCHIVSFLIHDLLFLPISTTESAVGKRLITHCCVLRLACSRLSGHIEPHSPRLQA